MSSTAASRAIADRIFAQWESVPTARAKTPWDPTRTAGVDAPPLFGRILCHSENCPEVLAFFHRTYIPQTIPARLRDIIDPGSWHAAQDELWLERHNGFAAYVDDPRDRSLGSDIWYMPKRALDRRREGKTPGLRRWSRLRDRNLLVPREPVLGRGMVILCPVHGANRVTRASVDAELAERLSRGRFELRIVRDGEADLCRYRFRVRPGTAWADGHRANYSQIVPTLMVEPDPFDAPPPPNGP